MNISTPKKIFSLLVLGFILASCSSRNESRTCLSGICGPGGGGGLQSNAISCAASSQGSVESGKPATITLQVAGGKAPYSVDGRTFIQATSVLRTFNTGSNASLVNDQILVTDSLGSSMSCPFQIVVYPVGTTGTNGLGCSILASNQNPVLGQAVVFTLSAIGGKAPYDFSFYPQNGSSRFGGQSPTNLATATTDFDIPGIKSPTLTVWSSDGKVATCNSSLTVRNQPSVDVVATPADAVPIGSDITLIANASDFLNNNAGVSFSFASNNPNVTINQSGNQATVRSSTSIYEKAAITVTANSSGESAQKIINVHFANIGFSCTVAAENLDPLHALFVGDEVLIRLTSSTSAPLEVTEFNPGTGGSILSALVDPIRVKYSSGGIKTLTLNARDAASKTPCNLSGTLQLQVTVNQPVGCIASVPSAAPNTTLLQARALIPSGYGSHPSQIRIVGISSSAGSGIQIPAAQTGLAWNISFDNGGTFPVSITVKDLGDPLQRQATCTAYHTSHLVTPICRVSFKDFGNNLISSIRAHNIVKIEVNSNLPPASFPELRLAAGAAVTAPPPSDFVAIGAFPSSTPHIRYTQNSESLVTATATVRGHATVWPFGTVEETCTANLNLTAPLSCSLSKASARAMIENTFDFISQGQTGTLAYNEAAYGANGYVPGLLDATVATQNSQGSIRYELDVYNQLPKLVQASTNTTKVMQGKFFTAGVYPLKAEVFDDNDNIGNTCELNDTNKLTVSNRLVADNIQNIFFTFPSGVTNKSCKLKMTNRTNRDNAVWWFNPWNGAHAGDAHHIGVNTDRDLTLFQSGNQCAIKVKRMGDYRYSTSHQLPDGPLGFDLLLEVTYKEGGVTRNVSIPLHNL